MYAHLFTEDLYTIPPLSLVVIVAKQWDVYSAEEKALLSKILGSVKLDIASVKVITKAQVSLSGLSPHLSSKILVFGSQLEEVQPYQNIQAQGFSVIKADDLSGLDDVKKKSLWLALKNMFGI